MPSIALYSDMWLRHKSETTENTFDNNYSDSITTDNNSLGKVSFLKMIRVSCT